MNNHTVEIAIPVYNGEKYIGDCIDSILAQTHQNFKIIISDNCSTDKTIDVIESYKDSRITLYRQTENIGAYANFNFLIEKSSADYVILFCADDVMLPWAVERQMRSLLDHPGTSVCGSDMIITDEKLQPTGEGKFLQGIVCRQTLIDTCVKHLSNKAGGPSNLLFVGNNLRKCRLDTSFKYLSDLILALDVCKYGYFINEGYPSYLYRRHPCSETNLTCPTDLQGNDWGKFAISYGNKNLRSLMLALSMSKDSNVRSELKNLIRNFTIAKRLKQKIAILLLDIYRRLIY